MIRAVRNIRAQLRIPSGQTLEAVVDAAGLREAITQKADAISTLARIEPLRVLNHSSERPPPEQVMTLVVDRLVVMLPILGIVDVPEERTRLEGELKECLDGMKRVQGLLDNTEFAGKAPEEVVEREQERLKSLQERKERLEEILSQLPG